MLQDYWAIKMTKTPLSSPPHRRQTIPCPYAENRMIGNVATPRMCDSFEHNPILFRY